MVKLFLLTNEWPTSWEHLRLKMIGHPSFAYVFREDVAHAQRLLDGKKLGDINPFHFKLRRKDGSVVCVDVRGTPMYNAAGRFG
jgi:hypothetical protein